MKPVENFRNCWIIWVPIGGFDKTSTRLIDKILAKKSKNILKALDKLILTSSDESEILELTHEQKEMLQMSKEDVEEGRLISQEAMDKRNLERFNEW